MFGRKMSCGMKCFLCVYDSFSSCNVENVFYSFEKKYFFGIGWFSFLEVYGIFGFDESKIGILRRVDYSLGFVRTEVVCK